MTWARALRRELGFITGMPVGAALFLLGFGMGALLFWGITIEQGQRLDDAAARKCIYLTPSAPRRP